MSDKLTLTLHDEQQGHTAIKTLWTMAKSHLTQIIQKSQLHTAFPATQTIAKTSQNYQLKCKIDKPIKLLQSNTGSNQSVEGTYIMADANLISVRPRDALLYTTGGEWVESKADISKEAGVYALLCLKNRRIYVGSSLNIKARIHKHFWNLRLGTHENQKLQNAFSAHGEDSFVVRVLELTHQSERLDAEQVWIDLAKEQSDLFNLNFLAFRPPSFAELTPEVREKKREKHRIASTGRPGSAGLLAMLAQRVGPKNPRFGIKIVGAELEARKGRFLGDKSPNYGKRGVDSPITGIKRSAETKKKMSENNAWKGKCGALNPLSSPCVRTDADGLKSYYGGAQEASKILGLGSSTVSRWCRGDRKPRDGSSWAYA